MIYDSNKFVKIGGRKFDYHKKSISSARRTDFFDYTRASGAKQSLKVDEGDGGGGFDVEEVRAVADGPNVVGRDMVGAGYS